MSEGGLDISANRAARPYSAREYCLRILWSIASPAFRYSLRPMFGWRRMILRLFGAKVGKGVHIYASVKVYLPWKLRVGDFASIGEWALIYNLGYVDIGERATISHGAHICAGTHDHRDARLPLRRLPVKIGAQAWVCANAFIGPGVTVGDGAIAGACAVIVKDILPWEIAVGNPSRIIGRRSLRAIGSWPS